MNFKVNDRVYVGDSCRRGRIVEIENDTAYVEFELGNIIPFAFDELRYSNPFGMVYLVATKELSDRNKQRQKHRNSPNIPEGTKFFAMWNQIPCGKFVTLYYECNLYQVKTSDLFVEEIEKGKHYCTSNHVY